MRNRKIFSNKAPWRYRLMAAGIMTIMAIGGMAAAEPTTSKKTPCPNLVKVLKQPKVNMSQLIDLSERKNSVCTAQAQLSLGYRYSTEKNYRQAFYWWQLSAKQNNTEAQYNLAILYLRGVGTVKDYKKALYWWEKAAKQGGGSIQYELGVVYARGDAGKQNLKKAAYWFGQAASHNFRPALTRLGYMYSHGEGVPVDMVKSTEFYLRAAVLGDPIAMYNTGFHYEIGLGIKKNERMALLWFKRALHYNVRCAANDLGILYARGGKHIRRSRFHSLAYFKHAVSMVTEKPDLIWQNRFMHYNEIQATIYAQYMYSKWAQQPVHLSDKELTLAKAIEAKFAKMCWE